MVEAYKLILKILEQKMGLIVPVDDEDFAISDYIVESIVFIEFILAIEEEIGFELSDDFLYHDLLTSAKGFSEKLDYFMTTKLNSVISKSDDLLD